MLRYLITAITLFLLLSPSAALANLTVTFQTDGHGTLSGSAVQVVMSGSDTEPVTAVPAADYHFLGWTGSNGFRSYENPLTVHNVTASMTVTAAFAPNRYDVIAHGLSDVADLKAGAYHTVVLKKDGSVVAWGGTDGQSDLNGYTNVKAIGAGAYHSLLVKRDGSLTTKGVWFDPYDDSRTPVMVSLDLPAFATAHGGVVAVTGGYSHSMALMADGTVFTWGDNTYNQLDVPDFGGVKAIAIAAGHFHNVVLLEDHSIVAWGRNFEKELAPLQADLDRVSLGGVTVSQIGPHAYRTSGISFSALDAQAYHTVALAGGKVVCWGDNERGQSSVPTTALSGVTAIAAGGHHTLALKDGVVLSWGDNTQGQSSGPAGLSGVTGIAAGSFFSLARRGDTAVVGWGNNASNQCNVPASAYRPITNGTVACTPTTVGSGDNFTTVCSVTPAAGATLTTLVVNGFDRLASVSGGNLILSNIQQFQSITAVFATSPGGPGDPGSTATIPGAPFMGTATVVDGDAVVSFNPPISDGGSEITLYQVISSPAGVSASGAGSPIRVTGLTSGSTYTFVVTAANAIGMGPPSASSNSVGIATVTLSNLSTAYDGTAKTVSVTTVPADLPVAVTYSGSARLPTSAGSYLVDAKVNDAVFSGSASGNLTIARGTQEISVTTPAPPSAALGTSFSVAGTAPAGPVSYGSSGGCSNQGASYTMTSASQPCTVIFDQAGNANYNAAQKTAITAATAAVPGTPAIVGVSALNGEATVSFVAPSFDGGSPVTGYTVTANPGNVTVSATGSPVTISGLSNGTAYTFTVSASNAAGTGAAATSAAVVPYPNADLNGDGLIDILDAVNAMRVSLGLASPPRRCWPGGTWRPWWQGSRSPTAKSTWET